MWENHKFAVLACFKTVQFDAQDWIYNPPLIRVLGEQQEKIKKRPKKNPSISISLPISKIDLGIEVLIDHNMAGRKLQLDCGMAGQDSLLIATDAVRALCRHVMSAGAEESGGRPFKSMGSATTRKSKRQIQELGIFKFFQSGRNWQVPKKSGKEMANGNSKDGQTTKSEQKSES